MYEYAESNPEKLIDKKGTNPDPPEGPYGDYPYRNPPPPPPPPPPPKRAPAKAAEVLKKHLASTKPIPERIRTPERLRDPVPAIIEKGRTETKIPPPPDSPPQSGSKAEGSVSVPSEIPSKPSVVGPEAKFEILADEIAMKGGLSVLK